MTAAHHAHDDRDHHVVECRAADGTDYFVETEVGLSIAQAADLIRKGEYERVTRVIQFNPVENFCRDVTEDAAREIANNPQGLVCRSAIEFIERNCGFDMANEVRLVAEVA